MFADARDASDLTSRPWELDHLLCDCADPGPVDSNIVLTCAVLEEEEEEEEEEEVEDKEEVVDGEEVSHVGKSSA